MIMKKWEKNYILTVIIIEIMIIICGKIITPYEDKDVVDNIVKELILVVIILAILIYYIICLVRVMKQGMHNIKTCDNKLFENIDQYKTSYGKDNQYYIKQIKIINFYYKESGRIDELIKKGDIEQLYIRADFLKVRVLLYDDMINCFSSLAISVVATFICQATEAKNIVMGFAWGVTILGCIFSTILFRYKERGQDGSYISYVNEYERNLLMKKIEQMENNLKINELEEYELEMKQIIINELVHILSKRRCQFERKEIEADIKTIEHLNLRIGNSDKTYKSEILINGKCCYIIYNKEKGKENNYEGKENLINKEYYILYIILEKYKLISCNKAE